MNELKEETEVTRERANSSKSAKKKHKKREKDIAYYRPLSDSESEVWQNVLKITIKAIAELRPFVKETITTLKREFGTVEKNELKTIIKDLQTKFQRDTERLLAYAR